MASFNRVIFAGNLTRDPELKYPQSGKPIGRISLAANRKWKTESGEQKEEVTFVEVDLFGKSAEVVSQYCKKGSNILVEGRLKLDQWDDKQTGQKRSALRIVCENFTFLSSGERAQVRPAASKPSAPGSDPAPDDDIPF